ncbi:MAG TPA: thioredoxin family protein [Mycobacteriales bacterium]
MTVVLLLCVLLATTCLGLVWRRRNGRMRDVAGGGVARGVGSAGGDRDDGTIDPAVLASLGVTPAAAPVTLVQFSSAFCQPCRATRRVLDQVTEMLPEVCHVEVDAESHLDAVRALGVLRTPTVLVLDRRGRVVRRASGQPRRADVIAAVAPLLTDSQPG